MSEAHQIDHFEDTRRYTYADYLTWEGPERYQLIDGEVFMMASPSVVHQRILMEVSRLFANWLKGKPCEVFAAPLDVRLFPKKDKSDRTVVQPDIIVVCKKEKIDKNSINGAPELVIEIQSPSNTVKEMFLKFQSYQKSGVKEYWIIEPEEKKVQVNIFDENITRTTFYCEDESINVSVLPGLAIDLKDVFVNI